MKKIKRKKLKYNEEQYILIIQSMNQEIREYIVDYVNKTDKPKFYKLLKNTIAINLFDIIAQMRHKYLKEDLVIANYNAVNETKYIFDRRVKIKNKS